MISCPKIPQKEDAGRIELRGGARKRVMLAHLMFVHLKDLVSDEVIS